MDARLKELAAAISTWLDQETLDHRNPVRLVITNDASSARRSIICSKAEPFSLISLAPNDLWLCLDELSTVFMQVLRFSSGQPTYGLMLCWVPVTTFLEMFSHVETQLSVNVITGAVGAQGAQGPSGPQGPIGPKGAKGHAGMGDNRLQVDEERLLKFVLRDPDVKATLPHSVLTDQRFVGLV